VRCYPPPPELYIPLRLLLPVPAEVLTRSIRWSAMRGLSDSELSDPVAATGGLSDPCLDAFGVSAPGLFDPCSVARVPCLAARGLSDPESSDPVLATGGLSDPCCN
jgi:hypothetical protein